MEYLRDNPGALYGEIAENCGMYAPKIAGYLEAMRDYGDIEIKPAGKAMRCYKTKKKGE